MVTFSVLALIALAGLGYWIRKKLKGSVGKKQRESARREAAAHLLAQDRLDCLELERSLTAGRTDSSQPLGANPAPVPHP